MSQGQCEECESLACDTTVSKAGLSHIQRSHQMLGEPATRGRTGKNASVLLDNFKTTGRIS